MFQDPDRQIPPPSPFPLANVIASASFATLTLQEQSVQRYRDVPIGSLAQASIGIRTRAGMMTGFSDGTFQPNAPLTRSQLVTMAAKAVKLPLTNAQTSFFVCS
jgi:hypothetical protein